MDAPLVPRFKKYFSVAMTLSSLTLICSGLVAALPKWLSADVPQDGELQGGFAGIFHFCLGGNSIADANCNVAKWSMDDDNKATKEQDRLFVEYTAVRVLTLAAALCYCVGLCRSMRSPTRATYNVEYVLGSSLLITAGGLAVDLKSHPHNLLRIFNFLGAIDYDEDDQIVNYGTQVEPTLEFDVSFFLCWVAVFLSGLSVFVLRKAWKHYRSDVYEFYQAHASNIDTEGISDV
eukprot:gb/GECG01015462.1/.p1 GENE.gb/GECG01015462.1/~~gb/GECG01015462.1/.p1  ORF type:complete len:234 (+),score=20.98 gb/GECG01015462.1/:1-702(+)